MLKQFEARWEGEPPALPQDAVTKQAHGYLWPIWIAGAFETERVA